MEDAIRTFAKQFEWQPKIENEAAISPFENLIVCGMGGSHLATGVIKMYKPGVDLYVHRDYGLPPYDEAFLKKSLLLASSYSGNTEEVLDFVQKGHKLGYNVAVLTTGGKLLEFAKQNDLPYIIIPQTGIQPRSAIGYQALGLAEFLGDNLLKGELHDLSKTLVPADMEDAGIDLAREIGGRIPVIYSSLQNLAITYNWKIKMNETAKIPAFYNIFPELNHNEISGFDFNNETQKFSDKFHFIFLRDKSDHDRTQKRMDITKELLEQKGMKASEIELSGETLLEKIFNSFILADWTALKIAKKNGADPERVPLIEDFKKRIAE